MTKNEEDKLKKRISEQRIEISVLEERSVSQKNWIQSLEEMLMSLKEKEIEILNQVKNSEEIAALERYGRAREENQK